MLNSFFNSNNKDGPSISFQSSAATFDGVSGVADSPNGASWLFSTDTRIQEVSPTYVHGVAETYDINYMCHDFSRILNFGMISMPVFPNLDLSEFNNCTSIHVGYASSLTAVTMPTSYFGLMSICTVKECGISNIDISNIEFNDPFNIDFSDNDNLTAITFPVSVVTATTTLFSINSNNLLGHLDLSNFINLGGSINMRSNEFTGITFTTSTQSISALYIYGCDYLTDLDLSPLTNISGSLWINSNDSLTAITFPSSSGNITSFKGSSSDSISFYNLSGLTGLSGSINISNCQSLTGFTLPNTSNVITNFDINACDILSTVNLSSLSGLGGSYNSSSCPFLTNIILPSSSVVFTSFYAFTLPGLTSLDTSSLSGLGGDIKICSSNNLAAFTFPVSTQSMTHFYGYDTSLNYVDFYRMSGGTSDNIDIRLENNGMIAAEVNHILVDLDGIGWTGGTIDISGTNAAPDGSAGGYNGTVATTHLVASGWTVTTT